MAKKKIINELVKIGKEQGYLTYKEMEKYLANDIFDLNVIEDLYDVLSESGIELVETEKEGNLLLKEKGIKEEKNKAHSSKEKLDLKIGLVKQLELDDPVKMYLKEIGRIKLLTAKQEVELAKRMQKGDHEAKKKLVE